MILYKSPIIGIIKKIISKILLGIYKVVSVFHLKATALVLAVGVLLLVTGSFGTEPVLKTVFWGFLGVTLLYALVATVRSFLKFGQKIFGGKSAGDSPDGVVDVPEGQSGRGQGNFTTAPRNDGGFPPNDGNYGANDGFTERRSAVYENDGSDVITAEKRPVTTAGSVLYPKYYAVKQNRNYVMAEYEDRYELFVKCNGGLKRVRTDYKR